MMQAREKTGKQEGHKLERHKIERDKQESEKGYEFQEKTDEIENFADEFNTNIDNAISELQSEIENL